MIVKDEEAVELEGEKKKSNHSSPREYDEQIKKE